MSVQETYPEFAHTLRDFLQGQGWPVNKVPRVILAGFDEHHWHITVVSAWPDQRLNNEDYIVRFARTVCAELAE